METFSEKTKKGIFTPFLNVKSHAKNVCYVVFIQTSNFCYVIFIQQIFVSKCKIKRSLNVNGNKRKKWEKSECLGFWFLISKLSASNFETNTQEVHLNKYQIPYIIYQIVVYVLYVPHWMDCNYNCNFVRLSGALLSTVWHHYIFTNFKNYNSTVYSAVLFGEP